MADKKKMSVEDILAACRGEAPAGGGSPTAKPHEAADQAAAEPVEAPAEPVKAAAEKKSEAPKPAGGGKPPSQMSVADILAAARGQGSAAAPKPAAPKAPAAKTAKPAAAKPAEKPAAKAAGSPAPAGPIDTSSILAAARQGAKPGPMSKSEAAAKAAAAPAAAPKRVAPVMPAKPAYAVPRAPAAAKEPSDRRGFFSVLFGSFMALGFTALGLTGTLWTLGMARFMFPNILIEPPSRFKVGFPSDFAPGSVETRFTAQFGIWIVNTEYEGQLEIVALKTVCTHLGCTPNWLEAEQKFKCPCHGSGFYKDGINFEGPAPRPLERYAIRIADDGQLEIDKSKTFQQELGQWSDPASYVPA
jgi:cytochrome b6-f complex iron-sulfur subunit